MTIYTIDDFWKKRIPRTHIESSTLAQGWSFEPGAYPTFHEAPLTLNEEMSSPNGVSDASLILVSAPGAVGKSTLARQIAFETGSVYLDLAKAAPVGGNTITGGLVKSNLYESWKKQNMALLIDGLDEARLRVTQEAFQAFLKDVSDLAVQQSVPTVIFGRTGAIQDAWLYLSLYGAANVAVLEIGYYNRAASIEFVEALLHQRCPDHPHTEVQHQAVEALLDRLRAQTDSDGDRFAGYAPVLTAVAAHIVSEQNPANLLAKLQKGEQPVTLHTVVSAIIKRERGKLEGLALRDQSLASTLYNTAEQLDRLVARFYGLPTPPLIQMTPFDAQTYSSALETWVPEHPFLDGNKGASSAVFEAVIITHAMKKTDSSSFAVDQELARGSAANPFVSTFYLTDDENTNVPPEHVGVIYSSLRAQLPIGDSASLSIEGPEDTDANDEMALHAQVEINVSRRDSVQPRVIQFNSDQTGILRLGGYVEDIDANIPLARVEIGPGPQALLFAPISIQCDDLTISSAELIAESTPDRKDSSVYLEANSFSAEQISSIPVLRGEARLMCAWPDSRRHPWTNFSSDPIEIEDPRLDEALRRFRKFVTAFRSHSKGQLARYQDKIEHARMTKGTGLEVLNLLKNEKILTLSGSMYLLDADRLGAVADVTYAECAARKFNPKTIAFVRRAITA